MIRLVVIDDHDAIREGLVMLLSQQGFEVVATAGSGLAAVDAVRHAEADIALLDTSLPDITAPAVTALLRRERPQMAVLLYSEEAEWTALEEALAAGASGLASKKGSIDELDAALEQVHRGEQYRDPRLLQPVAARRGRTTHLSPREREVLTLMAQGYIAAAVGEELGVSTETVRTHTRNAVRKMGARNRVNAITIALGRGEITLGFD